VSPSLLEKIRLFAQTGELPRDEEPKAPVHRRI
jgi:hypothetical protein